MTALDDNPASPLPPLRESLAFTGTGSEYFQIWIVNVLLTILTLGIYSAWAKVRRTQYFHRHTRLAGAGFDYHGDPIAILRGRMLAALMFGGYSFAGTISPLAGLVAFVIFLCAMPWLVCRSLRFRLHNTSYRGLRFQFTGTTREAYRVFLALPVASALTFGIFVPMWQHRLKRYIHSNAWYGRTPFSFNAGLLGFYSAYLSALGLLVVLILAGLLAVAPFFAGALRTGGVMENTRGVIVGTSVAIALYLSISMGVWAFLRARVQNLTWNGTQLGPHKMMSLLEARRLFLINITNVLGLVCTLGLFKPFAEVRLAKYVLSASAVDVAGSLNDFIAGEQIEISATGDEAVEMFDFDIAI